VRSGWSGLITSCWQRLGRLTAVVERTKGMSSTRGAFPSCPRVWVLTNPHPGNRIQAIALAEALAWPYEVKELHFTKDSRRRLPPRQPAQAMLDQKSRALLAPPWPDLVIGVGRSTAPVTRWISTMTHGQTRTVQLGRTGGAAPHHYDAVIAPCTAVCHPIPGVTTPSHP
jgi:uncharacterized protein